MLLLDTIDGRAPLCIEQSGEATLAVFDGTDPGHIKGEVSVHLKAAAATSPSAEPRAVP